jgi:hypothetical protein
VIGIMGENEEEVRGKFLNERFLRILGRKRGSIVHSVETRI